MRVSVRVCAWDKEKETLEFFQSNACCRDHLAEEHVH